MVVTVSRRFPTVPEPRTRCVRTTHSYAGSKDEPIPGQVRKFDWGRREERRRRNVWSCAREFTDRTVKDHIEEVP